MMFAFGALKMRLPLYLFSWRVRPYSQRSSPSCYMHLYALGTTSPSLLLNVLTLRCLKSVRIRSYSGSYFPAFGLNTNVQSAEKHRSE